VVAVEDPLPLVALPGDGGGGGAGGPGAGASGFEAGNVEAPAVGEASEVPGPDVAAQVLLLQSDLHYVESERDSVLAANDVFRARLSTLEAFDALRSEQISVLVATNNTLEASKNSMGAVVKIREARVRDMVEVAARLQQALQTKADQEFLRLYNEQESLRLQNQREAQALTEQAGRQVAEQARGVELAHLAPSAPGAPRVHFADPVDHRIASPLQDVRGPALGDVVAPGSLGEVQESLALRAAVLKSLQDQRVASSQVISFLLVLDIGVCFGGIFGE
jgi:hypothetical protein